MQKIKIQLTHIIKLIQRKIMIIILNLQNIVSLKILSTEKIMNNNHTPPNENGVDVENLYHLNCMVTVSISLLFSFYAHSIYSH